MPEGNVITMRLDDQTLELFKELQAAIATSIHNQMMLFDFVRQISAGIVVLAEVDRQVLPQSREKFLQLLNEPTFKAIAEKCQEFLDFYQQSQRQAAVPVG